MKKILSVSAISLLSYASVRAQTWAELGTGTGALNANGTIQRLYVDPSGNVYAAGEFTNTATGNSYVARWNGTAWSMLGTGSNGLTNANGGLSALTGDAAGNIYTAPNDLNSASPVSNVFQWNGTNWTQVGAGTAGLNANNMIQALATTGTGTLYAGGFFTNAAGMAYVAKWDGSNWTQMGTGINELNAIYIPAIVTDASGGVYIAAMHASITSGSPYFIAKWDGAGWTELGAIPNGQTYALAIDASGNLYAGGNFTNGSGNHYVAKWDGTTWVELGTAGNLLNANAAIRTVAVDGAGNVYAAGDFTNASGKHYVARWDGTSWTELGTGTNALNANNDVLSVATDAAGHVYAAGDFTNSSNKMYVSRFTLPPFCIDTPVAPAAGSNICAGSTTFLWNRVNGATGYDVCLNTGTGTVMTVVSANQPDTNYTATLAAGTYTWKVIPKSASGTATGCDSFAVTVMPTPTPLITVSGGVNLSTGSFTSYQWYKDGVAIPGATSQNYTATSNGSYTVQVTDAQGCTGTSAAKVVTSVSVGEVTASGATISVWPNPAGDLLHIESKVQADVAVFSIEGRKILQHRNVRKINTSGLSQGLYLAVISDHRTGQRLAVRQFQKQ